MTYTPQMLVWVYYKYGKVLFFSRNRINTGSWLVGGVIPIYAAYELVGWKNLVKKIPSSIPTETQSNTDWKLCSNSIMGSVYLNLKSITHPSENVVKGWIKVVYTKEGIIEFIVKFGKQYESLNCSLALGEINCSKKTGHFLSQIYYNSKGQIISQGIGNFPFPNPIGGNITSTEWEPIPPDTIADVLYKAVCMWAEEEEQPKQPKEDAITRVGVSLPKEAVVKTSSAELPKEIAAFSGKWRGKWNNKTVFSIEITKIDLEEARITYIAPETDMFPAVDFSETAKVILGENPKIQFSRVTRFKSGAIGAIGWFTFEMQKDLKALKGVAQWPKDTLKATMEKIE